MSAPIDEILRKRSILITCGTGGVGKTTLSAAMAMRAALLGKKTLVITIDPAKRLASSLGLDVGHEPTDLTAYLKAAMNEIQPGSAKTLKGSLFALMPDTRKTFESFFRELAPNEALANRIIANPIFQIFAKEFSGTNEYMALEKLYSLSRSGAYDCIILDTPPSRNTLDFLNAPRLLAEFFDERLIRWLVLPTNKLLSIGMRKALGVLEKLTGSGFMTHLFDFASSLFEIRAGFSANLKQVTALLESPQVGFIMVAAPTPDLVPDVELLIDKVKDHHMNFEGVALNRTLSYLKVGSSSVSSSVHDKHGLQVDDAELAAALEIISALQRRENQITGDLIRKSIPVRAKLPELSRDIHSMEDLFHVAMAFDRSLHD